MKKLKRKRILLSLSYIKQGGWESEEEEEEGEESRKGRRKEEKKERKKQSEVI